MRTFDPPPLDVQGVFPREQAGAKISGLGKVPVKGRSAESVQSKNSNGFFFVSKPTLKKTPRGQIKEPKGGENERKPSDQWQVDPPDVSNPNLCKQILKFKGTELTPHARKTPPLRAKIRVETVQTKKDRHG